MRRKQLKLLI